MLQGLAVSIDMLHEEGLDNVFARHDRLAEATRRAVRAWGLEILCRDPKYYSPTITAVLLPDGHDADAFRSLALDTFNISYGASFGPYAKKYFRIGHLGDINDGWMMGVLAATEMALGARRHPAQEGRRAGGDGLHRLGAFGRRARGGGVSRHSGAGRRPEPGIHNHCLFRATLGACSARLVAMDSGFALCAHRNDGYVSGTAPT